MLKIDHSGVKKKIAEKFEASLRSAFKEIDKKKRSTAISEIELTLQFSHIEYVSSISKVHLFNISRGISAAFIFAL